LLIFFILQVILANSSIRRAIMQRTPGRAVSSPLWALPRKTESDCK